jgi:hypothetical protein
MLEDNCRRSKPAAGATISDANVRPYRGDAAAEGNEDGRDLKHGRGYTAAPIFGQATWQGTEPANQIAGFHGAGTTR